MKLLLPVAAMVLAAGTACCCGNFEELLKQGSTTPTDKRVMVSVPANELVRIVDIHSEDAYYSSKDTLIGRACVTDEASSFNDGGWQGGPVHCGTDSYYFYKAAYEDMGPAPVVAPTPGGTAVPAIPGLRATASVPAGQRIKILDIHSEDAYYSDRSTILGKLCTTAEASTARDGEWHGGSITCDDGSSYYFYKAAYEVQAGAAVVPASGSTTGSTGTPAPSSELARRTLPNGERVKIMDIASDDAYYSDRFAIIGKTCTLGEESSFKDGQWHGGPVSCDDGSSYYFYKAAYKDLGAGKAAAAPAPVRDGRIEHSVPSGARVKIVALSTEDAFYSSRADVIGKTCTLSGTSTYYDGGWQGGQVSCDDGSSYYFYKAAYVMASGGAKATAGGADGRVKHKMPKGARVKIVDLSPEDAFYSDRGGIIGKSCTLDETSSYKEDGSWHGGQIHCDDGSSYYFYKAAYQAI